MLSVHKARYVKYIIACTVEHLLHSQHHCGLFLVTYWASTANVCLSKYLQHYSKFSERIKDIREVTLRRLWNNRDLGRRLLHTQIALSQELGKYLHTELYRLQAYISHCALLRVLTQSGFECVATTLSKSPPWGHRASRPLLMYSPRGWPANVCSIDKRQNGGSAMTVLHEAKGGKICFFL